MLDKIWLLIFGMAVVTWLPRLLPAALIERMHFSRRMEKFLRLIPYTAMTAMIVPGVFRVDQQRPLIGLAGCMAACLLAWRGASVMVVVLAAIGADLLLYLVF